MKHILLVFLGGGFGSIARFITAKIVNEFCPGVFPLATLMINLSGCFLIGAVLTIAEKKQLLSQEIKLLLATGFCGGFTTFSTFAWENLQLLSGQNYLYFLLYSLLSTTAGIVAVMGGIALAKSIL